MDLHGGNIYQSPVALDFSVNVNPLGPPEEIKRALDKPGDWLNRYPQLDHRKEEKRLLGFLGLSGERKACERGKGRNFPDDSISKEEGEEEEKADREGVEMGSLLGSGASELLMTYFLIKRPRRVLLADPSFYGYRRAALAVGAELLSYPLQEEEDFFLDEGFLEQMDKKPDLILLANPNNPNGGRIREELLEKILRRAAACRIPVMLDLCFMPLSLLLHGENAHQNPHAGTQADFESQNGLHWEDVRRDPDVGDRNDLAYGVLSNQGSAKESDSAAWSGRRAYAALLQKYFAWHRGLLILGAFTKTFAIPSLRLGYLLGDSEHLAEIRQGLPEWNLSLPAQIALDELFGMDENGRLATYLEETSQLLKEENSYLRNALGGLGFRVCGGESNFILFADPAEEKWRQEGIFSAGQSLGQILQKEKVLIRDCGNYRGLREGFYRVAILDHKKNQTLIRLLGRIVEGREKRPPSEQTGKRKR